MGLHNGSFAISFDLYGVQGLKPSLQCDIVTAYGFRGFTCQLQKKCLSGSGRAAWKGFRVEPFNGGQSCFVPSLEFPLSEAPRPQDGAFCSIFVNSVRYLTCQLKPPSEALKSSLTGSGLCNIWI